MSDSYELVIRDQAGARELLDALGALHELEEAVVTHCVDHAPKPPYRPQEIKKRLEPAGWLPEVRVPPFEAEHDELPIYDRYDAWKAFSLGTDNVGVALEIERWEVWNDLLKFRRGIERGQIAAGVILHDNPESLEYVYNHLRMVSGALFAPLPVAFIAPRGPGLPEPNTKKRTKYAAYLMP